MLLKFPWSGFPIETFLEWWWKGTVIFSKRYFWTSCILLISLTRDIYNFELQRTVFFYASCIQMRYTIGQLNTFAAKIKILFEIKNWVLIICVYNTFLRLSIADICLLAALTKNTPSRYKRSPLVLFHIVFHCATEK